MNDNCNVTAHKEHLESDFAGRIQSAQCLLDEMRIRPLGLTRAMQVQRLLTLNRRVEEILEPLASGNSTSTG